MKLYLLYTYSTSIDNPLEFIGIFKSIGGIFNHIKEELEKEYKKKGTDNYYSFSAETITKDNKCYLQVKETYFGKVISNSYRYTIKLVNTEDLK